MPSAISIPLVGIWLVAGLVFGFGWAVGHLLCARLFTPRVA